MRIAVVDDIAEDRRELAVYLEKYMKQNHLIYTLAEFENAACFFRSIAREEFDLVFMDIYMDGMNGIEAAKKLRQSNRFCKLIFLTVTEEYARMGYALSATHYLIKPLSLHEADFEEAMGLCRLKPKYDVMTIPIVVNRRQMQLSTEQILYIDHQNRMTRIHTSDGVIPVSESFFEVTAPLRADKRFLICYRGILVNMDYIERINAQTFRLTNGEELPITLRNGKRLRETCRQYIFSRMGGVL